MKNGLVPIRNFIQACMVIWPSFELTTVDTLLQNMIAKCNGNPTYDEMKPYLAAIEAASKMVGQAEHVIAGAHKQADMVVSGYYMSEAYKENDWKI